MALDANPKKIAEDIANGLVTVSLPYLKRLEVGELKAIHSALQFLLRNIRSEIVPAEETEAFQQKNRKMQRINNSANMMRVHAKSLKLNL